MDTPPLHGLVASQGLPPASPEVMVISSVESDEVQIFFWVQAPETSNPGTNDGNKDEAKSSPKVFFFGLKRRRDEIVAHFLSRCSANVNKKLLPKVRKPKHKHGQPQPTKGAGAGQTPNSLQITLEDSCGHDVAAETHATFWNTGQVMLIHGTPFRVLLNPPTISQLTTFQHGRTPVHVGTPIAPVLQTINGAVDMRWEWRRHPCAKPDLMTSCTHWNESIGPCSHDSAANGDDCDNERGTVVVGNERVYIPNDTDLGSWLSVQATPVSEDGICTGWPNRTYMQLAVTEAPQIAACTLRRDWIVARTRRRQDGSGDGGDGAQDRVDGQRVLRCMSYNILADSNVSLQPGEKTDQWPSFANRAMVVLREILQHDVDLVCLQEVDRKAYYGLLEPVLFELGWNGFHSCKLNGSQEGCAMFWRVSVLSAQSLSSTGVGSLVRDNSDLSHLFTHRPHVFDICVNRVTTIAQFAVLEFRDQGEEQAGGAAAAAAVVVVANTHLYFHAHADHVRLIQTHSLVKHLHEKYSLPVLLCGDLNSDPTSAAATLLLDGALEPSHESWCYLDSYKWQVRQATAKHEAEEEVVVEQPLPLPPPPRLTLPCDPFVSFTGIPTFTHWVAGFVATLDYVLYSPCGSDVRRRSTNGHSEGGKAVATIKPATELGLLSSAPMPDKQSLVDAGVKSLPCAGYASDHVSVLADVLVKVRSSKSI
jgi:mRNA deadenylase 3'-5' endonuclease subunit Ccr4